jgi:hypothetical protein
MAVVSRLRGELSPKAKQLCFVEIGHIACVQNEILRIRDTKPNVEEVNQKWPIGE